MPEEANSAAQGLQPSRGGSIAAIHEGNTRVLAAVVLASVALRLVSATLQGDSIQALPGVADQYSYDALARRVLAGHGFTFAENWWPATKAGEPTAHWSYLYTLYVAAVYGLFGHHPIMARLLQAVVAGLLQPWLTWRLGRRLFGQQAGLVAASIAAVYGYFVFYAGALMTETFYILSILWVFDLALQARDRFTQPVPSLWFKLGLALGLAILLRQAFLLFVPVLFGWLVWKLDVKTEMQYPLLPRLKGIVITTGVLGLLLLPWTLRNYRAFGQFVLLNTNAGYAMFWANHPVHATRFVPILPNSSTTYGSLIPSRLLTLNEAALDRQLFMEGVRFAAADPRRFLSLSLSRATEFFKFWPSPESRLISNIARVLSFGLLFPFAVFGLGISARRLVLRSSGRTISTGQLVGLHHASGLVLVYLFAVVYSLIHILSWALIRYRLPLDSVLVILASTGFVFVFQLLKRPKGLADLFARPAPSAGEGAQALLSDTQHT